MIHVPRFSSGDTLTTAFLDTLTAAIEELQALAITSVSGNIHRAGNSLVVPAAEIVQVLNDSGSDLGIFDILGISDSYFDVTDNNFQAGAPVFIGIAPEAGTHEGRFVVLLAAVANGSVGPACAAGVTSVHLNIDGEVEETERVDIADGESGYLSNQAGGSAQVLWREGGTGAQWGIVRLEGAPSSSEAGINTVLTEDVKIKAEQISSQGALWLDMDYGQSTGRSWPSWGHIGPAQAENWLTSGVAGDNPIVLWLHNPIFIGTEAQLSTAKGYLRGGQLIGWKRAAGGFYLAMRGDESDQWIINGATAPLLSEWAWGSTYTCTCKTPTSGTQVANADYADAAAAGVQSNLDTVEQSLYAYLSDESFFSALQAVGFVRSP